MGSGMGNPGASGGIAAVDIDTSAELRTILTDETGSGAAVFATSPTLVTPALGTPSALVLTNATGLPDAAIADPNRLYQATVPITKANIISAGFASNAGLTLVAAPGSGKILILEKAMFQYTWSTDTYGAGGNVSVRYSDGTNSHLLTDQKSAATTFGDTGSGSGIWSNAALVENSTDTATQLLDRALVLVSTAQFTDPGTAAGTGVVTVLYRIVTV